MIGTGTWVLARAALRRDRVRTPSWAVGVALLFVVTASSWSSLYPTVADRLQLADTFGSSPALTALYGPLFAPREIGGLTAWRLGAGATLVLALVNVFLVVRHSRAEEQDGRAELVLSGGVGRSAPLAAAIVAAGAVDLLLAVLIAALLGGPLGWAGTAAMAAAMTTCAFVFAGVAALTAQAARTSRGANGLASLIAAITFAMAVAANSASAHPGGPLLWLSPFGWAEQTRAFAQNRWWVIVLAAMVAVLLCGLALWAASRRDLGAGLTPTRRGRPGAAAWVRSPLAVACRLDRATLLAWVVAAAAGGVLVGLLVRAAIDLVDRSPQLGDYLARLGGTDVAADAYVQVMATTFALVAGGYAVGIVLRLHSEETRGCAELVLSTRADRASWALGRVVTAGLGALTILLVGGVCVGATYGAGGGDVLAQAQRYGAAFLLVVPAIWVLIGVTVAVVGAVPGATWLAWLALTWTGVVTELGAALGVPAWVQRTTPLWFASRWPAEPLNLASVAGLTVCALALVAVGLLGLRRRDLPA